MIRRARREDLGAVALLAQELWPHHTVLELAEELEPLVSYSGQEGAVFLCWPADQTEGEPVGFAQCQLRHEYVEGAASSPVGYLEGIYVREPYRRQGLAHRLLEACGDWAASMGCLEFASDCEWENRESLAFHQAMGFEETGEIRCFVKSLPMSPDEPTPHQEPSNGFISAVHCKEEGVGKKLPNPPVRFVPTNEAEEESEDWLISEPLLLTEEDDWEEDGNPIVSEDGTITAPLYLIGEEAEKSEGWNRLLGSRFACLYRMEGRAPGPEDPLCIQLMARDGDEQRPPRYTFHLQCPWRFSTGSTVHLASWDLRGAYDPACRSRFQARREFLQKQMIGKTVQELWISELGDLRIKFTGGTMLETFSPTSQPEELWRFIDRETGEKRIVFTEADLK